MPIVNYVSPEHGSIEARDGYSMTIISLELFSNIQFRTLRFVLRQNFNPVALQLPGIII
jgi:hypothetical protein